jgi:hypothetical protein
MKYKCTKIVKIEATLDSSEAVMFTKGGLHKITICNDDETPYGINFCDFDKIEFSVQLDRDDQGRFDFITSSIAHPNKQTEFEMKLQKETDAG